MLQEAECAAWRSWTIGAVAGIDSRNFLETLAAVESRAEQTLGWVSRAQAWPLPIGLDHVTLSRVPLLRAILSDAAAPDWIATARQHIQLALEAVQRANDIRFIAYPLLPAAWFHSVVGEWEAARQYLDEAFQLVTRGGAGRSGAAGCMRLHLIDTLLHRARIFGLPAGRRGAPEHYPWAG